MEKEKWLAEQFEAHRDHLQRVAYRMLGSTGRGGRCRAGSLVAAEPRRSRRHRQSRRLADHGGRPRLPRHPAVAQVAARGAAGRRTASPPPAMQRAADPEREAELADNVGLALLVVLEALAPAERVAFVLHDMFDLPFEEIAPIVGRSPTAARQLASRARRRVRGSAKTSEADCRQSSQGRRRLPGGSPQRRYGRPSRRARSGCRPACRPRRRAAWAASRNCAVPRPSPPTSRARRRQARAALVDGALGVVVAPQGRLLLVLNLTFAGDRIAAIDVVADPDRLEALDLSTLP